MLRDLQSTYKYNVKNNNDTETVVKNALTLARDKAKEYGMRMTKKNKLDFDQSKEDQKLKQANIENKLKDNEKNIEVKEKEGDNLNLNHLNNNNKNVRTQSIKLDPSIMRGKFDFDNKSRDKHLNNNVKKSTSSNF